VPGLCLFDEAKSLLAMPGRKRKSP